MVPRERSKPHIRGDFDLKEVAEVRTLAWHNEAQGRSYVSGTVSGQPPRYCDGRVAEQ